MRDLYDFVVHTPVKQESSFYVLGSTALVPELVEGRFAIRNSQFKIFLSPISYPQSPNSISVFPFQEPLSDTKLKLGNDFLNEINEKR
jgi:hypothetical protein